MRHVAAGLAFAALLLAGCENAERPTAGSEDADIRFSSVPENADLEARINGRINDLFPQPEKAESHRLFDRIKDAVDADDLALARSLVSDLLQLAAATDLKDPKGDETTAEAYSDFIDLNLQYVGVDAPGISPDLLAQTQDDDDGTVALASGDADNEITTEEDFAGTFIPDEALPDDEDVVIVIERLTEDEQSNLPGGECLPTGLEQEEGCYQFDRFPEGDFQSEVEVGVCASSDIDEGFQLHRFESVADGGSGVVEALPNIELTIDLECDPFTARSSESPLPWRLAEAAWRTTGGRVLGWLGPQRLEAVNVGFGGSTTNFSRIGWAKAMDLDIVDGDLQSAQPGSRVPIDPQVRVTHLPEDDNTVVQGADVTFTVVGGGGTLTAAEVTAVTEASDVDGLVSVPWRLGADGTNQLQAVVPGDTVMFTATTTGNLLASCTADPGGDQLSRGYYYPDYPASTLDRVDMFFSADAAGSYEIVLTAREDTYDGAVIEDDTVTVSLSSDVNDNQRTTFLFGGASVAEDTVAFEMELLSGPGTPFFAVSSEETCPLVETTDTSLPLSTERFGGRGVGADVYGSVN